MSILRRIANRIRPPAVDATVSVPSKDIEFIAKTPVTILEALRSNGIDIDHFCGGICSCGTCIVKADGVLSKIQSREKLVIGYSRVETHRLACQAKILGDVTIHLP